MAFLECFCHTKDFKVQDACFKEKRTVFNAPEHLITKCRIVEYDNDDQSVLLEPFNISLLDDDLCFL